MIIGWITLVSALLISSIAIYFSVAGMVAIFSAYAISIGLMISVIEVGKLVGVAWLHYHWGDAHKWLKTGIIGAVFVTMALTSMGIFGFLSKSHTEQTAMAQESVAMVTRVDDEITRNKATISRSEEKIKSLSTNGSGVDVSLQTQIDKEQLRIANAYSRVKDEITAQERKFSDAEKAREKRTMSYDVEVLTINKILRELQEALNSKDIRKAQGIIGTKPDGIYGSKTVATIKEFRKKNDDRRTLLLDKIDTIRSAPTAAMISAQDELTRVRNRVQLDIETSRKLIDRLQSRIGTSKESDIEQLITDEQKRIKASNNELDTLVIEKFKLESTFRKLEAEVGPVKHIAEFIYGEEAQQDLLERAVRWVIILIIVVFDPFAVLLLIAAQHSFDREKKKKHNQYDGTNGNGYQPIHNDLDDSKPPKADTHSWTPPPPPKPTPPDNVMVNEFEITKEDEIIYEPEPEMPENETVRDEEITSINIRKIEKEIDEVIAEQTKLKEKIPAEAVTLVKVGDQHINFNGKVYQKDVLFNAFPELKLDLTSPVTFSDTFPNVSEKGDLLIRIDTVPTQLFRFNGFSWDNIDKNLLELTAFSDDYIQLLINDIGSGEYNTELLNAAEKHHIERLYSKD